MRAARRQMDKHFYRNNVQETVCIAGGLLVNMIWWLLVHQLTELNAKRFLSFDGLQAS